MRRLAFWLLSTSTVDYSAVMLALALALVLQNNATCDTVSIGYTETSCDFALKHRRFVNFTDDLDDCGSGMPATDAIIICGARRSNKYRIESSIHSAVAINEREVPASRAQWLMQQGNSGIGSCSAVGPGGFTGCLMQGLKSWGGHVRF